MTALLREGYELLGLGGALLDDAQMNVSLYVEEDAEFLMVAADDLELLHQAGGPYQHAATLGDGLLTIAASCDGVQVTMQLALFPELNSANQVEHKVVLSRDEYVWWWRSLARQLEKLAGLGESR